MTFVSNNQEEISRSTTILIKDLCDKCSECNIMLFLYICMWDTPSLGDKRREIQSLLINNSYKLIRNEQMIRKRKQRVKKNKTDSNNYFTDKDLDYVLVTICWESDFLLFL